VVLARLVLHEPEVVVEREQRVVVARLLGAPVAVGAQARLGAMTRLVERRGERLEVGLHARSDHDVRKDRRHLNSVSSLSVRSGGS
jgi:hypothetical protein